jgi:peptide-methionine (S)-S-oxide reductase
VGYAGGTKKYPTYHNLGDHTEAIQLDYDPSVITFAELLGIFFASHDPTERSWSQQYMAIAFYHSEEQLKLIREAIKHEESVRKREIRTAVLPGDSFYIAEDYHQKHALQHDYDLMSEFRKIYPDFRDIISSTAAARVNGILGGYGKSAVHKNEMEKYGLSERGRDKLAGYLRAWRN